MMRWLLTTRVNTMSFWLYGALMLTCLPLAMLIDLQWFAPNWRCDSVGIPIMQAFAMLPIWAAISTALTGLLVLVLARRRVTGLYLGDILAGLPPLCRLLFLPAAALAVIALGETIAHLWNAVVPQTIGNDCGGNAEMVQLVRRGPVFQTLPPLGCGVALWSLSLTQRALSPRRVDR